MGDEDVGTLTGVGCSGLNIAFRLGIRGERIGEERDDMDVSSHTRAVGGSRL